jgi:hypothetical protein
VTPQEFGAWKDCSPLCPNGGVSRGGVLVGVEDGKSKCAFIGSTILEGRDLEREERWNGEDMRRFFFSSLGVEDSIDMDTILEGLSGVVVAVAVVGMNSGSSDASRDDERELGCEAYVTDQHMYS